MKEHALGTTARYKSKQARIMVKPGIFVSLLFFLAFTLLGAGVFWHYASERADRELLAAELVPVLDRSQKLQEEYLRSLIWQYEDLLRQDLKSDYYPLRPFLQSLQETHKKIIDLAQDDQFPLSEFMRFAVLTVASTKSAHLTYLRTNAKALYLDEDGIKYHQAYLEETIDANPFPSQDLFARVNEQIAKGLIASALSTIIGTAAENAASMITGRNFSCGADIYFPVFGNPSEPDQNGLVSREVGIGLYPCYLLPEYVTLVVNGDTLALGEDGLADYRYFPKACEGKSINTELTIINALTGKRNGSTGEYLLH